MRLVRDVSKVIVTAALLIPVVMAGLDAAAAEGLIVSQKRRAFNPTEVTLDQGRTLTIVNDDTFVHHAFIKSDEFSFDSGEQKLGARVPIRLTEAGTFEVRCAIHPKMRLSVIVKPRA